MRDYADEVYLHARIYAMRSRLLSLKDYTSLARNQNEAFHGNTEGAPDPAEAGERIFQEQTSGIIRLAETTAKYTPLFLSFLRQFEAINAKLLLARAFNLQSLEQWYDIGRYSTFGHSILKESPSPQDIVNLLKGTYLDDVVEDLSSFDQAEARVDLCTAKDLYKASVLFKTDDKLDFQNMVGRRIAVTSAIISLRLKKTYQWDDERISEHMEKLHESFDGDVMRHIKFFGVMVEQHIEHQRANGMPEPSLVDIEHYLEQYYYKWISAMFHRDFHSVCCIVAYLWMLYYQIRNLIKIIEGRRFGYSPERILANIVCNS
jgi:vacuolar-type H+-ATPase subunit C/Vma6